MNWKDFIQKALSEDKLIPSEMRVKAFYVTVVLVFVVAFGFVYTVIAYKELIIAYLGIVSALIGTAFTFKLLQKDKEI